MMRRFAKLRSMRRITREQAAAALAVAAVACLSSVIIHWSQATPVREPAWQHPLFGDLSDDAPSVAAQAVAPQPVAPQLVSSQSITPQSGSPQSGSHGDSVVPSDHEPRRPTDHIRKPPLRRANKQKPPVGRTDALSSPFVTLVKFTEPEATNSELVRVVGYESRAATEAAWLSGAIEEEAVDAVAAPAASSSQIRLGEPVPTDH